MSCSEVLHRPRYKPTHLLLLTSLPIYISHPMHQTVLKAKLNLSYVHTQVAMASAKTFSLLFLATIFILSLVCTTVSGHHEEEDPEFQRCQSRCRHQHQHDPAQLKECQRRCEERHREEEGGGGGEGGQQEKHQRKQLERCKQECRRGHGEQEEVKVCEQQCEERYHGGGRNPDEEEEQGREGGSHPYTFGEERLKERVRTEDGSVRVTPRFGHQSELVRGIDNYRVALLEANPNSFVAPNHYDAEAIFFISRGTGVVTFLRKEKESANVERGNIVRVPAGTTFYVVNKDNSEKLHIVIFFQTVSTPGKYRAYFGAAGENPESFFRSFSDEVLEAAFNAPRDKVRRIFSQQRRGPIFRISKEQVQAIADRASSSEKGGSWPFHRGDSSIKTHNLFHGSPSHSNKHGQYFEAGADEYDQLGDLDVSVSFANITSGSMIAPYYNSRSTKLAVVVKGAGWSQMACPHLGQKQRGEGSGGEHGEEEQEQGGQESYHTVDSQLKANTILIIPAGLPSVTVASHHENLEIVCFNINSKNNNQYFLAGKNNIYRKMDKEEMEVSFNLPAEQVKKIFDGARDSHFLEGPEQGKEGGGGRMATDSILELAMGLY